MTKKTVVIYATCQGDMIKNVLNTIKSFTDIYEIKQAIHNYRLIRNGRDYIDTFGDLHTKCDLWINQPLSEQYNFNSTRHLQNYLKDSAKSVTLTYVYNYAFWPLVPAGAVDISDDFTISNVEKIKNQEVILDLLSKGASKEDVLSAYANNSIDWRYVERFHECRQIQRNKESTTDVKVQDYIDVNLTKHRLFWYPSHPTHYIIYHIVNQILKLIDLAPVEIPQHADAYDTSPGLKLPYTDCAQNKFNFAFDSDKDAYDYYMPYLQRLLK